VVMPEVITGLSLLLLFVAIGFDRGFWTLTLAHTTFAMCFVAVVVQSRLVTSICRRRKPRLTSARRRSRRFCSSPSR
jgi:ABC-type spermidine/putrescine transport system permease subunit II